MAEIEANVSVIGSSNETVTFGGFFELWRLTKIIGF